MNAILAALVIAMLIRCIVQHRQIKQLKTQIKPRTRVELE